MFYYINGVCLNLNKVLCFNKGVFASEQTDSEEETKLTYTISILFEGIQTPLVIVYDNVDSRDADFAELMEVEHGYSIPRTTN